mgnify:CR=1 FL=1
MERNSTATFLLTAALVLIFGYFGIDKFVHPLLWIGWVPLWLEGVFGLTRAIWLQIIGFIEIVTALLILCPLRNICRGGLALAILQLLGILTQTGWNDIGARDAAILLSALALFLLL